MSQETCEMVFDHTKPAWTGDGRRVDDLTVVSPCEGYLLRGWVEGVSYTWTPQGVHSRDKPAELDLTNVCPVAVGDTVELVPMRVVAVYELSVTLGNGGTAARSDIVRVVKRAKPKLKEVWINIYPNFATRYDTQQDADTGAGAERIGPARCIPLDEVKS